jgi:hypothetical protein
MNREGLAKPAFVIVSSSSIDQLDDSVANWSNGVIQTMEHRQQSSPTQSKKGCPTKK